GSVILVAGQIAALSGCAVWPTMTRPAIHVSVQDQDGRPVKGAAFHFAKYSTSMVPRHVLNTIETDERGDVEFESERCTFHVLSQKRTCKIQPKRKDARSLATI